MRIDRPLRWLLMGVLLAIGLLVSYLRPGPGAPGGTPVGALLWHGRGLDLVVQLGLLLVGALGIRAMLPGDDDEKGGSA
ncbi:MAG: hypothetical protein V1772_04130 [Chloroflexota bacterium]